MLLYGALLDVALPTAAEVTCTPGTQKTVVPTSDIDKLVASSKGLKDKRSKASAEKYIQTATIFCKCVCVCARIFPGSAATLTGGTPNRAGCMFWNICRGVVSALFSCGTRLTIKGSPLNLLSWVERLMKPETQTPFVWACWKHEAFRCEAFLAKFKFEKV